MGLSLSAQPDAKEHISGQAASSPPSAPRGPSNRSSAQLANPVANWVCSTPFSSCCCWFDLILKVNWPKKKK